MVATSDSIKQTFADRDFPTYSILYIKGNCRPDHHTYQTPGNKLIFLLA